MAMPGYFIEVTFTDGKVVTTYATVVGDWYYFYSDKRYRFTRGVGTNVILQQYQPIGTNMAWYDVNIIQSVDVQQFDPSTAGGGATPDDVYTKEETDKLIQDAVNQIMANIDEIVAQKVDEAVAAALGDNYYTKQEVDDKFVKKSGDTMTGALYIRTTNSYFYCNGKEATIFGENYNAYMNPADGFGVTNKSGKYAARVTYDGHLHLYNSDQSKHLDLTYEKAQVSGNSAFSFNTTVQVPSDQSFLVSGSARYGGNFINRYGPTFLVQFNDVTSAYFSGGDTSLGVTPALTLMDNSGNMGLILSPQKITGKDNLTIGTNTYYAIQISGTKLTLGSSAYDLEIDGQNIKLDASDAFRVYSNTSYILATLSNKLVTAKDNSQISISDMIIFRASGGDGNIIIYDHLSAEYSSYWQFLELGAYVKAVTSAKDDPSTNAALYAPLVATMGAINSVINAIQDHIGTNYSAAIPQVYLTGGGSTRGGGCGRGY